MLEHAPNGAREFSRGLSEAKPTEKSLLISEPRRGERKSGLPQLPRQWSRKIVARKIAAFFRPVGAQLIEASTVGFASLNPRLNPSDPPGQKKKKKRQTAPPPAAEPSSVARPEAVVSGTNDEA